MKTAPGQDMRSLIHAVVSFQAKTCTSICTNDNGIVRSFFPFSCEILNNTRYVHNLLRSFFLFFYRRVCTCVCVCATSNQTNWEKEIKSFNFTSFRPACAWRHTPVVNSPCTGPCSDRVPAFEVADPSSPSCQSFEAFFKWVTDMTEFHWQTCVTWEAVNCWKGKKRFWAASNCCCCSSSVCWWYANEVGSYVIIWGSWAIWNWGLKMMFEHW